MPQYITDLHVSLNENDESDLGAQGFSKYNVDLNRVAGGKINIHHMRGDSGAITRIQFSLNDAMSEGLTKAGYRKIPRDLGNGIYMWIFKGSSEYHVPIVNLDLWPENKVPIPQDNWERLSCDLKWYVFLWVKREYQTYICDIDAIAAYKGDADYFNNGYIRADENTNKGAKEKDYVFLWYRETTKPEGAIKDLQVSSGEDVPGYVRVNVDLNQGTGGNSVFLWYKKDGSSDPIKDVSVANSVGAADQLKKEGWVVIPINSAPVLYLCYRR